MKRSLCRMRRMKSYSSSVSFRSGLGLGFFSTGLKCRRSVAKLKPMTSATMTTP